MNSIFKAYDIRGTYPDEINENIAFRVGWSVATKLQAKRLIVGWDGRVSSPALAAKVIEGITSTGCEVVSIKEATTPLFYFAVNTAGVDGGVMITASHNPKEYNGFKIVGPGATPMHVSEIQELMNREPVKSGSGSVEFREFVDDYVNFILEETQAAFVDLGKLKIVVDASNGMTGLVLKNLFRKINLNAFPIYFDIDGTFPNHTPDTTRAEALLDLRAKVIELGADLGVVFDGDGDRIALIDETGEPVWADHILGILYQAIGYPVTVYDLRISRAIRHLLGERGFPSKVGYVNIKQTMREVGADLGGELSGHFFYKATHYAESAVMTMMLIIVALSQSHVRLSELVKPFRTSVKTGEIDFELGDKNPAEVIERLKQKYQNGRMSELDGLTVEFEDWWFNVRPSNTEPLLRLVIETEDTETLQNKTREITAEINS